MPDYLAKSFSSAWRKTPPNAIRARAKSLTIWTRKTPRPSPASPRPAQRGRRAHRARPQVGAATISIEIPKSTARWSILGLVAVLAVGVAFTIPATRQWILGGPRESVPGHPRHSLAVLPAKFVGDDSQKYLADGVVETLAAKLAGLKDVYVASVSATDPTMALKDDAKIARSLGVTLLVRTTVTISGDRISIIVAMDSPASRAAAY